MMKALTAILISILCLSTLIACKQQPLPIPPYPLSTDTITEALQEYGLSHKLQEDEQVQEMRPEQSLISLLDSESGELAAGISSGQKDGERILFISFPRFHSTNPILREECEDAVVFATRLFGGFESADQVYDSFVQDYDTVNTERVQYEVTDSSTMPMHEGESYWESSIGGATCRITFEQPSLSEPEEYLSVILFTSDWDTFYPEGEEKRE